MTFILSALIANFNYIAMLCIPLFTNHIFASGPGLTMNKVKGDHQIRKNAIA